MIMNDQFAAAIHANVSAALEEDLGSGDKTAELVPATMAASAIIICREPMTLAGQPWVDEIYRQVDANVEIQWLANDGDHLPADGEVCVLTGPARSLLSAERTALNFLQTLSATATATTRYVSAVAEFKARILDTRKTIPGLRIAQKYAVRCGGGNNHRLGLFDAILIKENHISGAGGVAAAIRTARELHSNLPIEIEVESVSELQDALRAGTDRLLLDNFDIADLQRAVEINHREGKPPADLEASGGLTIDEIVKVAETGVDYISVGALTKNVNAIDLSMRFRYPD
jgi:nicotinate-nucleotide pyrophosphorylase (carboxylating)